MIFLTEKILGGILQGKRLDMKVFSFFQLFMVFLFSCGCEKDEFIVKKQTDDKGVVIATPFIWKTSLHQKEPMSNSIIKNQIIYNDNIVVPRTNGYKSRSISLISSKDGKVLWDWKGQFEGDSEYYDIPFHYQFENFLTYHYGASYCINLDNGNTQWRHIRDRSFIPKITGSGQFYFSFGDITNTYGYDERIAFKGDIQTGNISEFLTANFFYECLDCVRGVSFINQVSNKDNLLLISFMENLEDWVVKPYFGLYDNYLKEWVWDRVLITPPKYSNIIDFPPVIENDRIYAVVDNCLVCYDLNFGKEIWVSKFSGNFLFSGFILEDGKVIANNEDTNMYALDAETGRQLWSVPTAGTSSRMSYLNGVVYMVGGSGGGRLFAIEAATGKILWRIDAGLLGEGHGARFRTNAVYVLPAKGDQPAKVIALSDLYAYCFEAVR